MVEFVPKNWEEWKRELKNEKFESWKKRRNDRLVREWDLLDSLDELD